MNKKFVVTFTVLLLLIGTNSIGWAAPPPWDGMVLAPLKTAQDKDWSAPDDVFTGFESANVMYQWKGDKFYATVEIDGFYAGDYIFTVNEATTPWPVQNCDLYAALGYSYLGGTFPTTPGGCWTPGGPFVDVGLVQADTENPVGSGLFSGSASFEVPFPNGNYDAKFFIKYADAWHIVDTYGNWNTIMMFNDMVGNPKYGKVTKPKDFIAPPADNVNGPLGDYIVDFRIEGGIDDLLPMCEKDASWKCVSGGAVGQMLYNYAGPAFIYDFKGEGLAPGTNYSLIYYGDPWPGDNPGALIDAGTSDGVGDIFLAGSVDLGIDLPDPADANYPGGAKIWLVLSGHYDATNTKMINWSRPDYLFEIPLITYDDTDVP
jgi:hypothetical protein